MNTTIRKFVNGEREKQLNKLVSAITVEDYADFNLLIELSSEHKAKLDIKGNSHILSLTLANLLAQNPNLKQIINDALILTDRC